MNDEIKKQWFKRKVRELGRLLSGLPEDRRRRFRADVLHEAGADVQAAPTMRHTGDKPAKFKRK